MTTPELKPCPFCGGTEIHFGPMEAPGAWMVGCNNYDCPLGVDSVTVEFGTPEKAAAAWNTRATDANLAALQAEIDALRTRLEDTVRNSTNKIEALRTEAEQHLQQAMSNGAKARAAQARAEQLAEALEEIRSRSCMNLAMNPNPYELTALLGDIHQIADAALAQEADYE